MSNQRKISYTIKSTEELNRRWSEMYDMACRGLKGGPVVMVFQRVARTLAQNRRMWAVLGDVAAQVEWYGMMLSDEDWKNMFSAVLQGQRVVPGINGGFVVLGVSTRKKDKEWFSDLFETINAFGAERGVKWSDPALAAFDYYKEARAA